METVNNFIGGLFQDLEYSAQPKGSYRNLLNAVRGVDGTPSNEKGTTLVATVKENYEILKLLELDVDVIIFSTDGTNSEIGILDKNDVYTTYINTTVFKFSKENLISAVAKKNYKGERVAYFTDGVQPVRRVNLDNLP
jgi:soluble P-type ATPase